MPRPRPDSAAPNSEASVAERLQKVMAAAGIGSRRACEALILAGRVEVDGETVTQLGAKVTPEQTVKVDGEAIRAARKVYYLVHKPLGVVTTNNDPSGRPRVIDLLPDGERLFPVGRLDRTSSGLILVTNDGALAQRLTHPKYGIEKTYRVQIAGVAGREAVAKLLRGVHLAEGVARADSVKVRSTQKQSTWLEIVLSEGKNREIRRILAKVGHKVLSLKRVSVGPLRLGDLEPGAFRQLSAAEVAELWRATRRKRKTERREESAIVPEAAAKLAADNEVFVADGITISSGPGTPAAAMPLSRKAPTVDEEDGDEGDSHELEAGFAEDEEEGGEVDEMEGELLVEEYGPGERPIGPVIGEDDEDFVGELEEEEEVGEPEPEPEQQRGRGGRQPRGRRPRFAQQQDGKRPGGRKGASREGGSRSGGASGGKRRKTREGATEAAFLLNSKGKRRKKPGGKRRPVAEGQPRPPRERSGEGRAAGEGEAGARPPRKPRVARTTGSQTPKAGGGGRPAGAKPRKPGKFGKKSSGRPAFGKAKGKRKVRRGKGRSG